MLHIIFRKCRFVNTRNGFLPKDIESKTLLVAFNPENTELFLYPCVFIHTPCFLRSSLDPREAEMTGMNEEPLLAVRVYY